VDGLVGEGRHEREAVDNSTEEHEDVEEYGGESEQKGWV